METTIEKPVNEAKKYWNTPSITVLKISETQGGYGGNTSDATYMTGATHS